ncbi:MAG: M23 family metallopeptidase [Gemmatimonadota bacterium]
MGGTVRTGRIVAGVVWGSALLALGIWSWSHVRSAIRYAELLSAEPPGTLPIPIGGLGPAGLADTWGDPRSDGRSHQGIDIFAARRTPVRSTTAGIVARRGHGGLGGRTVTIVGPGGQRHYYAHLQQYGGQARGEWVAAGEVIGFVGTSGNAPPDAPHLHYGIYTGGGAVNPYPLLTVGPFPAPAVGPAPAPASRTPAPGAPR